MEDIKQHKENLQKKMLSLPEERQKEILEYYNKRNINSVAIDIFGEAKQKAEDIIRYADRRGYGYGEVGYNINEAIKEFAEDMPEIEKEYKYLINAYFDFLTESKNI